MTEPSAVAYEALDLAKQNERDIKGHEDLCAERYKQINTSIGEIKGILKWAGGALFSIIIGLLAFLAQQQFHANEAARKQAEAKIELLERQLQNQARAPAPVVVQPQP